MQQLARISIALSALVVLASAAYARGFIQITTLQSASVADGRSTVEVRANVLDDAGRPVRDGTQVVFSTTLGEFRNPIVETRQGIARNTLRAGGIAGVAKITASAVVYNAVSSIDFLFVRNRELLSSAKEYVEITSPNYLVFNPEVSSRVLEAAGPNKGVRLRYREVEIDADDLQFDVPNYAVKARRAHLRMGSVDQYFDELFLTLNTRTGYGITRYEGPILDEATVAGRGFRLKFSKGIRTGLASVDSNGVHPPNEEARSGNLAFVDLTEAVSLIAGDKAVVFPRREIQFQRAEMLVAGKRVMRMPMYSFNMNSTSPLVTDNIFNVNDNQLALNYPHFLSLKPGQTSLLRLRTGESYGRGGGAIRGLFLDYEMNWNQGDEMDGGLLLSGIARNDWTVGIRQYKRFTDRTDAFAQIEMPQGRTMYGSVNLNHKLDGYDASITASTTQTLRGSPFSSSQYGFAFDREPIRMGKLPVNLFLGLQASHDTLETRLQGSRRILNRESQSSMSLRARFQMLSQKLDRATNINAEFGISRQFGTDVRQPIALRASTSISRRISNDATMLLTYNFVDDGFSSSLLGRHQLSLQGSYTAGRTELSVFGNRSLDVDRFFTQADLSYFIGGPWRLSYAYTYDRYLGESFLDTTAMLSYRLGMRDIGITYSRRTKRFGIQVLNATFR